MTKEILFSSSWRLQPSRAPGTANFCFLLHLVLKKVRAFLMCHIIRCINTCIFYWESELSVYSSVKRYYGTLVLHLNCRIHSQVSAVAAVWQKDISATELRETTGVKPVWHIWEKIPPVTVWLITLRCFIALFSSRSQKTLERWQTSLQILYKSSGTSRLGEKNWQNIQILCS